MIIRSYYFFIGSVVTLIFIHLYNKTFELNDLYVNIIIAFAATVAVIVHIESVHMQKKSRIWDMNKNILLDLSQSLLKSISYKNKYIEEVYEFLASPNEDPTELASNVDGLEQEEDLEKKINNLITLYSNQIGNKLTQSLKIYQNTENKINAEVFDEELDNLEAYERSLEACNNLHGDLIKFIQNYSGVNIK